MSLGLKGSQWPSRKIRPLAPGTICPQRSFCCSSITRIRSAESMRDGVTCRPRCEDISMPLPASIRMTSGWAGKPWSALKPADSTRISGARAIPSRASAMGLRQWLPSQRTKMDLKVGLGFKWIGSRMSTSLESGDVSTLMKFDYLRRLRISTAVKAVEVTA